MDPALWYLQVPESDFRYLMLRLFMLILSQAELVLTVMQQYGWIGLEIGITYTSLMLHYLASTEYQHYYYARDRRSRMDQREPTVNPTVSLSLTVLGRFEVSAFPSGRSPERLPHIEYQLTD